MGIFDEAIREHLDLKRRHGAADTELRKLEDEAFGLPARPGQVEAPAPPPAEPMEPLPELVEPGEEPVEPVAEPPLDEEHPAMEHRTVDPAITEPGFEGAETAEYPPPEGVEDVSIASDDASRPPEDASIADQPTEFYDYDEGEPQTEGAVEDEFFSEQSLSDELDQALEAPEAEHVPPPSETGEPLPPDPDEELPSEQADKGLEDLEDEGEDVLEETPDFLQETPEHDRLWFEQKPPKDFDFDD